MEFEMEAGTSGLVGSVPLIREVRVAGTNEQAASMVKQEGGSLQDNARTLLPLASRLLLGVSPAVAGKRPMKRRAPTPRLVLPSTLVEEEEEVVEEEEEEEDEKGEEEEAEEPS